jgi:putative transposase
MGTLLSVKVHAAKVQDRDGAKVLLREAREKLPRLVIVWADRAYKGGRCKKKQLRRLDEWVWDELGCLLEVVKRPKEEGGTVKGFVPLPKRWVVERTFACLSRYRRLSKDYEFYHHSSQGMIYLASAHLLLRRLCA